MQQILLDIAHTVKVKSRKCLCYREILKDQIQLSNGVYYKFSTPLTSSPDCTFEVTAYGQCVEDFNGSNNADLLCWIC